MFDHRFHIFLRDVILSEAKPIGTVTDYFYRVEFQQRGSPHMHCLFWVRNAPKIDVHGHDAVCDFIDQYVTCTLPSESEDSALHDIVKNVQQHSKKHSKSCKKKGTVCRFNFPRPPSQKTFISTHEDAEKEARNNTAPQNESSTVTEDVAACKQQAKELLNKVWKAVNSLDKPLTCEELFQQTGVDQQKLEDAYQLLATRQSVILKRNPAEVWVNQYNAHLLRCWDANMDIQFVLDPFSCIVYIISYISKAEREMGMLLRQTKLESEEGNLNARQTMKAIGSAYLHHREVGVQEAVYRVCGLHMKECSRKVTFIPVGENPTRMTKPLSQIKRKSGKQNDENDNDDDDDIWMTNIIERYQSRPRLRKFEKLCLASFCSEFRVLPKSQIPNGKSVEKVYQLQHNKGFIQKRSRTDPAIIRYPRFNVLRQPEEYYQSMLQLFLPYWTLNQLKPPGFDLYQTFYETGKVRFKGDKILYRVREVVEMNRSNFVQHEKAIQAAEDYYDKCGIQEDAWATLCPETEMERHESNKDKRQSDSEVAELIEEIPDFEKDDENETDISFHITKHESSRDEIVPVLRSLNDEQTRTFYYIRDWCLQKSQGLEPDPFHIFITGGAGTGKSHLVKAIEYEATRILAKTCSEPDQKTVLLTAFTGTAAFNIGGCTIHHAFKFNRGFPIPYDPLKEQALNPLRVELQDLQILVIDEVSMVYKRLLYYIHERLVQIKKKQMPFGGISVLAVGDFYQLPPVKQSKSERLYNDNGAYPVDYWKEYFSVVVLKEIMRQKDDVLFAEILNVVRTRTNDIPLPNEAKELLSDCSREGPPDVLHVYATNKEVNKYNIDMLKSVSSEMKEVLAKDFRKDKRTGKLKQSNQQVSTSATDSLPDSLLLAEGARVMLTRNVDVSDGLVNGATGTITSFLYNSKDIVHNNAHITAVEIEFDNNNVGRKAGKQEGSRHRVCIKRVEDELKKTNIVRHQFPIKLAWACTAHKVQGMTTEKVVVNLDNIFSPGQAYVALSRVTSKEGLYIDVSDTDKKTIETKIYADKEVEISMKSMRRLFDEHPENKSSNSHAELILFNAQSLRRNIAEIRADQRFRSADVICITETWIRNGESTSEYTLNQYQCFNQTREDTYSAETEMASQISQSRGGGVAMYIRNGLDIEAQRLPVQNVEGLMCRICQGKICLILVYRPPQYSIVKFCRNLSSILHIIKQTPDIKGTVVLGDFNENVLVSKGVIQRLMENHGYTQIVSTATTENGTLIDHVYLSENVQGTTAVMPTYYSDHEAISITLHHL